MAVKLETDDSGHLSNEVRVLRELAAASEGGMVTPKVHWHGVFFHAEMEQPAFTMKRGR